MRKATCSAERQLAPQKGNLFRRKATCSAERQLAPQKGNLLRRKATGLTKKAIAFLDSPFFKFAFLTTKDKNKIY
jgi:hypothetical protein